MCILFLWFVHKVYYTLIFSQPICSESPPWSRNSVSSILSQRIAKALNETHKTISKDLIPSLGDRDSEGLPKSAAG